MKPLVLDDVWASHAQGRFGAQRTAALRGVSLAVEPGEVLCVVGQSGSGKSTLLRCAARLHDVDRGRILVGGADVTRLRGSALRRAVRRNVQIVFQDPVASFAPRRTVGASIAEPLVVHRLAHRRARRERVEALAARVGLDAALLGRRPAELSGGQMQRAALARALAVEPAVLLLDEPTSALDATVAAQILELLETLRAESGLAMVLVTHDLSLAAAFGHRIAVLLGGCIVEEAPAASLATEARHPYTRMLLDVARGGPAPPPAARGTGGAGCAWAAHCPQVEARCHDQRPDLAGPPGAHRIACWALSEGGEDAR